MRWWTSCLSVVLGIVVRRGHVCMARYVWKVEFEEGVDLSEIPPPPEGLTPGALLFLGLPLGWHGTPGTGWGQEWLVQVPMLNGKYANWPLMSRGAGWVSWGMSVARGPGIMGFRQERCNKGAMWQWRGRSSLNVTLFVSGFDRTKIVLGLSFWQAWSGQKSLVANQTLSLGW